MERTRHPGIYKRGGRYVVVWRHRGRQHKSFHRTMAQALEAQGQRRQVDRRAPAGRETLEQYARNWLEQYSGRTARGLAETTRHAYRRSIESYALPFFCGYRLAEVEPPDVRAFIAELERGGLASASVGQEPQSAEGDVRHGGRGRCAALQSDDWRPCERSNRRG
jgi:hypothetical protein